MAGNVSLLGDGGRGNVVPPVFVQDPGGAGASGALGGVTRPGGVDIGTMLQLLATLNRQQQPGAGVGATRPTGSGLSALMANKPKTQPGRGPAGDVM